MGTTSGPQIVEETPYSVLGSHIALKRRIRYPKIELKSAVASSIHSDAQALIASGRIRSAPQQQAPSIGNGDCERSRTGPCHESNQDRDAETEDFTTAGM